MIENFQIDVTIEKLRKFLPSQSPLKDFVHHNTLHAFQDKHFEQAIRDASKIFGYQTSYSLQTFRELFSTNKISPLILESIITKRHSKDHIEVWMDKLVNGQLDESQPCRLGQLRKLWKEIYKLDINSIVNTNLFRILSSYLDQGIAITPFPSTTEMGFLQSIIELEKNSYNSIFKSKRVRKLLLNADESIATLLKILVGDETYFEQYLFDQQFSHPGWSGMVATIEKNPKTLLDNKNISLEDLITLECLLEIDCLDHLFDKKWLPLSNCNLSQNVRGLFEPTLWNEFDEVIVMWQEAYEWSYYEQALLGVMLSAKSTKIRDNTPSFQAFFCIDDRVCSLRRHLEQQDTNCSTYGTAGHFGIDAYFQPKNAKHYSLICPATINPHFLIREVSSNRLHDTDPFFNKSSHSFFKGWLISQTFGFWSAFKLMFDLFKPRISPATSYSFSHMENLSSLTVENRSENHQINGLQIGYSVEQMADRVTAVLKSTGTTQKFAPIVYIIGHGASSTNNTHYAGYDCGACSGKPGSVNARAFCYMANHVGVRKILEDRGIIIPGSTEFIGGLHDTTRDEISFFDEELLSEENWQRHQSNVLIFQNALKANAKERSRKFISINSKKSLEQIHSKIKERSVALFEPRPELNHATNALCIVGQKNLSKNLFLDRRAFLNTYNYIEDSDGYYLQSILKAIIPVCGGINLEYYFSKTDNQKLGAGSKLPYNVVGLIGVANGFEGDLRPGLPLQMVENHDPIRLMMIVEQEPDVVIQSINGLGRIYEEWFLNEWIHLIALSPKDGNLYRFSQGDFQIYIPSIDSLTSINNTELTELIESTTENLPVFQLVN